MTLRNKVNLSLGHLSLFLLAFMFFVLVGIFQFSLESAHAYPDMGDDCASCHDGSMAPLLKGSQGSSDGAEQSPSGQGNNCMSCHDGDIDFAKFEASAHGGLSCVTCHENAETFPHKPLDPEEEINTKADLNAKCATCHQDYVLESYNRSFHGIAVTHGYDAAASCADCHGNIHYTLSASDPDSPVAPANLAETCDKCHPGMAAAGANIANGKEHVVPEDKEGAFPLWITWKIFLALILFDVVMNGTIPTLELLKMWRDLSRPLVRNSGK